MKPALPLLLLTMVGCTVQPPLQQTAASPLGALRCISLDRITARRVEPGALVYELAGGASYRNDLHGACPSLQRAHGSEVVESVNQGPQLCRDDRIRIYDAAEARGVGSAAFPQCRLGDFVPITTQ